MLSYPNPIHDLIAIACTEDLNDLVQFDISTLAWTNIGEVAHGKPPGPRADFSFAQASGKLFIFGGATYTCGLYSSCGKISCIYLLLVCPIINTLLIFNKFSTDSDVNMFSELPLVFTRENILGDFFQFDINSRVWSNLTGQTGGPTPIERYATDTTSAEGKIYMFGGTGNAGIQYPWYSTVIRSVITSIFLVLPVSRLLI